MDHSLCDSLLKWLKTFPQLGDPTVEKLTDGVAIATVLSQIDPQFFSAQWMSKIKLDVGDNWRLKVSNLRKVQQGVIDYHTSHLGQSIRQFPIADLNKIGELADKRELGHLLLHVLSCAINCEQKQRHIEAIMGMEESVQTVIVNAIQLFDGPPSGVSDMPTPSLESSSGQLKSLLEQVDAISVEKENVQRRCHELELQISLLSEENSNLSRERNQLQEKVEVHESQGDMGSRYKDLRKQVDHLQGELFKFETSCDEYRGRVETLEKENAEVNARNEQLQIHANEAQLLKDEVDALKSMKEKVEIYEGIIETYKKRLEELSDLRRQVKVLEEKKSEYVHHNMELEEEIKSLTTLRPQLELSRKQTSDLHKQLADEVKKTDRQVFENKKLTEKVEALTQERDRVTSERDKLRENEGELKCVINTLDGSNYSSRPPSELVDVDTFEILKEKLVRLEHENHCLKQQTDNDDESAPVLQSQLSELQERHENLLQENRWDKFPQPPSPPWPPSARQFRPHPLSHALLDAYFTLDAPRKLKLLKKNLKWASESDLLILRQPRGLLASFMSPTAPSSPKPLPPPPPTSGVAALSPLPHSKDHPIVIHHIHEFKMPPSPTNEDSGCCRTSPSSCEGCEDHSLGICGTCTPDYAGTLDSGVSGMYRCLSPVIPSIVEECTAHHVSDIIPAIVNQDGTQSVMYHSYPSHSNCYRCCSPKSMTSDGDCTPSKHANSSIARPHSICSCSSAGHITANPNFHFKLGDSSVSGCLNNPLKFDKCSSCTAQQEDQSKTDSCHLQNYTTLPHRSDPPESPTPHNSPRLPHSMHNSRNKGGRTANVSRPSSMYASGIKDHLPLVQNALVARAPSPEKTKSKTHHRVRSKSLDKTKIRNDKIDKASSHWSQNDAKCVNKSKKLPANASPGVSHGVFDKHERVHCMALNEGSESADSNKLHRVTPENEIAKSSASSSERDSKVSRLSFRNQNSKKEFREVTFAAIKNSLTRSSPVHTSSLKNLQEIQKDVKNAADDNVLMRRAGKETFNKSSSDPGVTLLTDSLFTHFVISPPKFASKSKSAKHVIPQSDKGSGASWKTQNEREPLISATDTDDLEYMENKLVSSAYGAPLVSSESFVSVGQSEMTDMDPSATEYCTESEDHFNPNLFRSMDSTLPLVIQGKEKHRAQYKKSTKGSLISMARANKIFHRKKLSNCKSSTTSKGGVIKLKNKTAKAVVAETFNAMFTLCTP